MKGDVTSAFILFSLKDDSDCTVKIYAYLLSSKFVLPYIYQMWWTGRDACRSGCVSRFVLIMPKQA